MVHWTLVSSAHIISRAAQDGKAVRNHFMIVPPSISVCDNYVKVHRSPIRRLQSPKNHLSLVKRFATEHLRRCELYVDRLAYIESDPEWRSGGEIISSAVKPDRAVSKAGNCFGLEDEIGRSGHSPTRVYLTLNLLAQD